jgi:2-keto-4-pentenoate hydratase/2-oxohepta-3-ene-1,7-dioic acid hydratase in catechol pathway
VLRLIVTRRAGLRPDGDVIITGTPPGSASA